MQFIRQVTITPHQARDLEQDGFKLTHISMHLDGTDTYGIYVR